MNQAGYHVFSALGESLLFHVPAMACYALSPAAARLLRARRPASWLGGRGVTALRHGPLAANDAYRALSKAGLFVEESNPPQVKPESLRPLSTLELCVTHACNLACRYCYGSREGEACDPGLLYGASKANMSVETAKAGVDALFARSGTLKEVRIVFFGGEPFLNLALVREVTAYAEARAAETGKRVRFSAVTNGTTLTQEVMELVRTHRIHLQISMDGPPEVHDANRAFRNGHGSYQAVCHGTGRGRPDTTPPACTRHCRPRGH